ncbi:MAG: hypothetical protein QXN87_05455 [Candidatus Bathyarchaeia archaeon]
MSNDKLLYRVLEGLPEQLKKAYEGSSTRGGSEAHEILKLLVAQYMWNNEFRCISFEKTLNGGGQEMHIDIYEDVWRLYIECERYPDMEAVASRMKRIKDADPGAKFILAVQDRMGWTARKFSNLADEVWVVSRDGQVKTPQRWVEDRTKFLRSTANMVELQGLKNACREAEEICKKYSKLLEEESLYWQMLLGHASIKVFKDVSWLKDVQVEGVWNKHLQQVQQQIKDIRTKIIEKHLELLNATLSLSSPYLLKLTENGNITVEVDWDNWQWLGWQDYPNMEPRGESQYQIMEKNIQLELKMATKKIKKDVAENDIQHTRIELINRRNSLNEIEDTLKILRKEIENVKQTIYQYMSAKSSPQPHTTGAPEMFQ